jgi:pimeloyl-ACP methyl ester carboxylesterase
LLGASESTTDRSFNAISMRSGPKPQLVWVPGGRGISVLAFREVTALLSGRSVSGVEFALPAHGTDPKTVEVRANELVSWLVERGGPYHLAGFCLGGFVAFEAAQILRRRGLNVGMLALINCYDVPNMTQRLASRAASGVKRIAVASKPTTDTPQEPYVPDESEVRNNRVMKLYKPGKYAGKIHIFASETSSFAGLPKRLDPRMNFVEYAESSQVHFLPGDHEGILAGAGGQQLAKLMQVAMQAAENR